jgi:PHD/YefM family antitoxin component YafN of YafNO toxin-antitoxin module
MANSNTVTVVMAEFRKNLRKYLGRVEFGNAAVLIVNRDKTLRAAVISPDDYNLLEAAKKAAAPPPAAGEPARPADYGSSERGHSPRPPGGFFDVH